MPKTALEHTIPSEESIEAFLRGEGDLKFRSAFGIDLDSARLVSRQAGGSDEEKRFLAIKGVATTAETDDNGVEIIGNALRSLPDDFSRRTTVLFNHDVNMPIGRLIANESTKFIGGRNPRVEVNPVLIDVDAELRTGQRVVDAIERGTLDKFSFAWSTKDGIVVFTKDAFAGATDKELEDLGLDPDEDVRWSFRIGLESAPKIRVFSITGVELSIVSVPADAGAGFGMASFSRNFEKAFARFSKGKGGSSILVPENYKRDEEGEIIIPIVGGAISSRGITRSQLETLSSRLSAGSDNSETEVGVSEDRVREIVREEVGEMVKASEEVNAPIEHSYDQMGVTDRPWDEDAAGDRYLAWRVAGNTTPFTPARHTYDVVDGELVSNVNALRVLASGFSEYPESEFKAELRKHLFRLYTEVHGVDSEDVPTALKECEINTPEGVNQERE